MAINDNTVYGLYGSQIKDLAGKIEEKQDELTAGEGISIADESGALVISSTGGGSTITMTTTDPGEGSALAANNYIGVYGDDPIIMDYSTTEINTGAKWIDGSAIYKKTVDCGALPDTTTKHVAHNISNLSRVISVEGWAYKTQNDPAFPIPYASPTAVNSVGISVTPSNNIAITAGSDRSSWTESYVTIRYTKSS